MSENTKIEWATHTFNPWWGCTKVAVGCTNCYADALSKRTGRAQWGDKGTRVMTSQANWREPLKWNKAAEASGERHRVFCASMADVFEDWRGLILHHSGSPLLRCDYEPCGKYWPDNAEAVHGSCDCGRFMPRMDSATMDDLRRDLFKMIDATPCLDWLLLTKRPESIVRMWPKVGFPDAGMPGTLGRRLRIQNAWLGTSIATRADAERNIPLLRECRDLASVLFLSIEPLIEDLGDIELSGIDWVIVGGESGHGARPMDPKWVRSIREQCVDENVRFFFKQWGEWITPEQMSGELYVAMNGDAITERFNRVGKKRAGRLLDYHEWNEFPEVKHG